MQIHELPSSTPDSASDSLAFDTGSATYRAPFSSFETGGNTVTFTSDDETSPTSYMSMPLIESPNTLGTLIRRLSRVARNLRYVWAKIGTTAMGTTADTVTGAIYEIMTSQIGSQSMGTQSPTVKGAIGEITGTIGTVHRVNSSGTGSLADSTYISVGFTDLEAGTWIVIGKVRFSANANGVRRLNFSTTAGDAGWQVSYPGANYVEDIECTMLITCTETTRYYLNAWQNSGSTLSITSGQAQIRAVRVGL